MLKSVVDRHLVEAWGATMRGEPSLYPGAINALIRDYLQRARDGEDIPGDPLTARESEIVKLIAESYSSKQIADALVISEKTVEPPLQHLRQARAHRPRRPDSLRDPPRPDRTLSNPTADQRNAHPPIGGYRLPPISGSGPGCQPRVQIPKGTLACQHSKLSKHRAPRTTPVYEPVGTDPSGCCWSTITPVRDGLTGVIGADPELSAIATAATARDAAAETKRLQPDVVVVDYYLPDQDGLSVAHRLKALEPPPAVLVYSAFADPAMAIGRGVAGRAPLGDAAAAAMTARTRFLKQTVER